MGHFVLLLFVVLCLFQSGYAQYTICCQYCRPHMSDWVTLGSKHQLSDEVSLVDPPAIMVDEQKEVIYKAEGRDYKVRYAGAPLTIKWEDLRDATSVQQQQFIQMDLAVPKSLGGLLTQGGFYEERIQGLYPKTSTWISEYVISISNDTISWTWVKSTGGSTKTFEGNKDATSRALGSFDQVTVARFVRIHPLKGTDDKGRSLKVMARISMITCQRGDTCEMKRVNCLHKQWADWSVCACAGTTCSRTRSREIIHYDSCGGSTCGDGIENETCTPPEPLWKTVLTYLGISLAIIIFIVVAAVLIYKRSQKNVVEVIIMKDGDDDEVDHPSPRAQKPSHPPPAHLFMQHPQPQPMVPAGLQGLRPRGPTFGPSRGPAPSQAMMGSPRMNGPRF